MALTRGPGRSAAAGARMIRRRLLDGRRKLGWSGAGPAQMLGRVAREGGEAELGCGEEMGQRKETGRKQGREGRN